jgi:hypothetical protein
LCPPIVIPVFLDFFWLVPRKEWDHIVDESASHILQLLHRSFLAKWRSAFQQLRLIAFTLCGMRLHFTYFMLPRRVYTMLKVILYLFNTLWGSFILLLLVFQKFLEPKSCCTLKRDSDNHDCFLQSHIFTVIKTELSDGQVLQNPYRYHHMIIHFHTYQCVPLWMNLT